MNLDFSERYAARPLTASDADAILTLCAENEQFYRYHPPLATKESVLEDLSALPPGRARRISTTSAFSTEKHLLPCWISFWITRRRGQLISAFL